MTERMRNVAVGVTALMGFAGLALMLLLFGYSPSWFRDSYTVTVMLPNAARLDGGSRVHIKEIDVGQVTSVELRDPPGDGVMVKADIRSEVRIPKEARVRVEVGRLLGGTPTLIFDLSDVTDPSDLLPTDGTAELVVRERQNSLEDELLTRVDKLVNQFDGITSEFKSLSKTWDAVGRDLDVLLRKPAADAPESERNLYTAVVEADKRLVQMEKTINAINELVGDDELRTKIRRAVDNIDKAAENSVALTENANETIRTAGQDFSRLTARYQKLADDLSAAITTARAVLDKANEGEGTVAKLLNEPELYENLNDTLERAQATLDEVRQVVEKLKEEGLPVKVGG